VFIALPAPVGNVVLASGAGGTIEAGGGITFAGVRRLADIKECDIVCVPGGRGATDNAMHDQVFLAELRRLAAGARDVTSVCTEALVLGAAGLLRGKRATTHWAWHAQLALLGAIREKRRVVRDGNLITGGDGTAGIDFPLTVVAALFDAEMAQTIQLGIEDESRISAP
jgi:transcriptional regulator GlxA family with amidase domain